MEYFLIYLLIMNASSFNLMRVDKHRAKNHLWRVPELTLMLNALVGGSVGILVGMYVFRHKTRHLKFTLGVPLILAVQVPAVWMLLHFFS